MKNPITEKLIAAVNHQVTPTPDKAEIDFLRDFYHRLSGQDFTADKAPALRAMALRHRQLGAVRAPGKTLLDIYNLHTEPHQDAAGQDITIIHIITDDKPFLIDSLTIQLNAMRKTPHHTTHPNFEVRRDSQHRRQTMSRYKEPPLSKPKTDKPETDKPTGGEPNQAHGDRIVECYLQLVIDFTEPKQHKSLLRELRTVLTEIEIVVKDWAKMRARTLALAAQIGARKTTPMAEHEALLRWMENDNFAFLGYAEVDIEETARGGKASIDEKSLLGVLRAAQRRDPSTVMDMLPPLAYHQTSPMVFTKSRQRSSIHRANYLDCILLDRRLPRNPASPPRKYRIYCMLGFLAGTSTMLPTVHIPHLRNKTARILKESTLRPSGYAYKKLQLILETLPREKLFQMEFSNLYGLCMTILNHVERRNTRAHLHRDICGHFYSCLVYVPRDLFNSTLRQRIQTFLQTHFAAEEVSFNVYFSDSILTRIHYLIHCRTPTPTHTRTARTVDAVKLEREIQRIARDWNDNLHECFRQRGGHKLAQQMLAQYRDAFTGGYQNDFSVAQAVMDIERFAHVAPGKIHAALTCQARSQNEQRASFKLYAADQSLILSDVLPILENMGIRILAERPYQLRRQDNTTRWLHDFDIVWQPQQKLDAALSVENFQTTFTQAWYGNIENDAFNQLTLRAGLNWQEVSLLRAYYRYLKQIRLRYSEQYSIEALVNHPELVVSIMHFFNARFNPARNNSGSSSGSDNGTRKIKAAIHRQLAQVATLDEERIIRALFDVVNATVRTNYYQTTESGAPKPYLALKLTPDLIPHIPQPAPKYEIFVCSPRVEGTHLRGGKVARGGLRWSDRHEDFRTEVLGLAKAQQVKNAVIVPVGSKGGFIVKQLPTADREASRREVIACYQLLISGLLDLTDNLSGNRVLAPPDVVRKDGDDPYLVVAADKGTATFSDIANDLSTHYGFWLGDAFASGGSTGYDHKKMGITARGAWESVKRHFRELGKDIQTTDFTVIGIGDMGGDVFGNGMLLSRHIRLLAAFNHMHIFIDPNPHAADSYRERQRLFALPRSSWDDYNRKLLSAGGGIFARSAKSIRLSRAAKKALGADQDQYTPDELIHLILQAEVELLWNGGIGTYVKATAESHATVQDKSNDGVRVDAAQLQCKVIGEGGNLGMTQLARSEYALGGGRCYTDAIDNSAGVDTSDHEVNIKILLNAAIQRNLLSPQQRNKLLASMTDEVALLVLRNNYAQTQTLSLEAARSSRLMPQQCRAIDALEAHGLLNRELEFLPSHAALEARREQGKWLTRAELAVLLSYSKMDMYQALLASEAPDDAYLAVEIERYFPPRLAKKYPALVRAHRLKREIICTQLTNQLIGMMGPGFHLRLAHLLSSETAEIARAYLVARDLLDSPSISAAIEALDNKIAAAVQLEMLEQVAASMQRCIVWLVRNHIAPLNIQALVATLAPGCKQLNAMLNKTLGKHLLSTLQKRSKKLQAHGAPAQLAEQIAALPLLGYAVDIVELSKQRQHSLRHTAAIYFQVREILALDWIEQAIDSLPLSNDWHERARFSLGNDLRASHSAITSKVLAHNVKASATARQQWLQTNRHAIHAIEKMTTALKAEAAPDFAMLSVLLSELAWLH